MKGELRLPLMYGYYGSSNIYATIKVDDGGWIRIYNDYGERMYSGGSIDSIKYLIELTQGKYS